MLLKTITEFSTEIDGIGAFQHQDLQHQNVSLQSRHVRTRNSEDAQQRHHFSPHRAQKPEEEIEQGLDSKGIQFGRWDLGPQSLGKDVTKSTYERHYR
jgi:hypothetical protein